MDQRINDRGIMVDQELIGHAVACDLLYKETVTKKAYEISGLENPNSVSQLKDWLNERASRWIPLPRLPWKNWWRTHREMWQKC